MGITPHLSSRPVPIQTLPFPMLHNLDGKVTAFPEVFLNLNVVLVKTVSLLKAIMPYKRAILLNFAAGVTHKENSDLFMPVIWEDCSSWAKQMTPKPNSRSKITSLLKLICKPSERNSHDLSTLPKQYADYFYPYKTA